MKSAGEFAYRLSKDSNLSMLAHKKMFKNCPLHFSFYLKMKDDGKDFRMSKFGYKYIRKKVTNERKLVSDMVKMYDATEYISLPVILNYGRNNKMLHHSIILIGLGKIIYYEPYGTYSKFGIDYRPVIKKFVKGLKEIANCPSASFRFYHDLEEVRQFSNPGLQTLTLRNKIDPELFKFVTSDVDKKAKNIIKTRYFTSQNSDPTIYTMAICDVYDEDADTDPEIKNKAFELFGLLSCKLCVTISLIELGYFVKDAYSDIMNLYLDPNTNLMKSLDTFKFTYKNM